MHPNRPCLLSSNIHSVNYDSLLTIVNISFRSKKVRWTLHFKHAINSVY